MHLDLAKVPRLKELTSSYIVSYLHFLNLNNILSLPKLSPLLKLCLIKTNANCLYVLPLESKAYYKTTYHLQVIEHQQPTTHRPTGPPLSHRPPPTNQQPTNRSSTNPPTTKHRSNDPPTILEPTHQPPTH